MYSADTSQTEVRGLAEALHRAYHPYLLRIALSNSDNEAEAEEALQEAFASFIRAFDPQGEAPALPWLTTTLKRQCWRQRREAHHDRYVGQEAEPGGEERGSFLAALPSRMAGPEESVIERDEARRRLARLKPDERAAVLLRGAGFSYQEIGRSRDWSYTKVNRCVSEGRAALRMRKER
jgi:RNA polymerase sigma factor (sigma-70 family)